MSAESPKIRFSCACGKQLAAPAAAAGRRARCPQCQTVVEIPRPEAELAALDPLADELRLAAPAPLPASEERRSHVTPTPTEAGRQCPSCKRMIPPPARICTACGIDLKTGRFLQMVDDSHLDRVYANTQGIVYWLSWLVWFGIFPITTEAFGVRRPWMTYCIGGVTILVSFWFFAAVIYTDEPSLEATRVMMWAGKVEEINNADLGLDEERLAELAKEETADELDPTLSAPGSEAAEAISDLGQFHWYQTFTAALVHADFFHLLGNMLMFMVFGPAVNKQIGNLLTLICYPLLAVGSSLIHLAVYSDEALHSLLGASGAIMGLAGMYFVLLTTTRVHVVGWWRWGLINLFRLHMNIFGVRGFWVVLTYIALDVLFIVRGAEDGVAHWAHFGGFLVGAALGLILLLARVVDTRGGDLISTTLGYRAAWLLGGPTARRWVLW